MTNRAKGLMLAFIAPIMWGLMGMFSRNLDSEDFSDFDISFLRCFIAGIGYLMIVLIADRRALKTGIRGFLVCFISGAIIYSLSFLTYNMAVQRIPIAAATVLMFISPVWVLLIGRAVFKDRLERKHLIGVVCCFLGAVLVSGLLSDPGQSVSKNMDPVGILMGILNGICMAAQIMVPRLFEGKYSKDAMLVYGFLGGALLLAFNTDFSTIAAAVTGSAWQSVLVNILGICVLCTLVANVAFVKSTEYIGTATVGLISTLEVVLAAAVGFIAFGETLAWIQIAGAVLIVAGTIGVELADNH